MPSFSIIIPVKPGGDVAALSYLRGLHSRYPFELLVAEGCLPSRQRNAAVKEASGEFVYFLDDDSLVVPDCLAVCAQAMEDPLVAVAGGPSLTPTSDSFIQQLFGCALASLFGAGAVRNRYRAVGAVRETTEKELILCNLAMRRDLFLSLGGFDERLYPNEENELLDRVVASGHKLVHIPHMVVQRSQRKTLRQFVRQMFSYGRGRAQQSLISGSFSIVSFAPLFFLVYVVLIFFAPLNSLMLAPLIAYLVLDVLFALSEVFTSGAVTRGLLLFLFPLIHISNGFGLLWGLMGGVQGISRTASEKIEVKRIKTFEQVVW